MSPWLELTQCRIGIKWKLTAWSRVWKAFFTFDLAIRLVFTFFKKNNHSKRQFRFQNIKHPNSDAKLGFKKTDSFRISGKKNIPSLEILDSLQRKNVKSMTKAGHLEFVILFCVIMKSSSRIPLHNNFFL